MAHRNAPLTPEGRRRLCQRVDAGRPICHVAAEAGVARQTLAKWHARWKADGPAGLQDRSSRPVSSPGQVDAQVEDVVEYLRRHLKLGPVMLAAELREFLVGAGHGRGQAARSAAQDQQVDLLVGLAVTVTVNVAGHRWHASRLAARVCPVQH